MKVSFSKRDIATFVSPMRGAAVAIPAAKRFAARAAWADLWARLYIVVDDEGKSVENDGGRLRGEWKRPDGWTTNLFIVCCARELELDYPHPLPANHKPSFMFCATT